MNKAQAVDLVKKHLVDTRASVDCELVVLEDATLEYDFGWVFFYESNRYLATRRMSERLARNAPLVVTKSDGMLHETGTAYPIEHYLREFES